MCDSSTTSIGPSTHTAHIVRLPAISVLLLMLAAAPAWAVCIAPKIGVPIPDGATATREAMLAAKQALTEYQTSTQSYVSCVADSVINSGSLQEKALAALRQAADRFNSELRKFKEKNGG